MGLLEDSLLLAGILPLSKASVSFSSLLFNAFISIYFSHLPLTASSLKEVAQADRVVKKANAILDFYQSRLCIQELGRHVTTVQVVCETTLVVLYMVWTASYTENVIKLERAQKKIHEDVTCTGRSKL